MIMHKQIINQFIPYAILFVGIFLIFELRIEIPTLFSNYLGIRAIHSTLSNLLISLTICSVLGIMDCIYYIHGNK